MTQIKDVNFVVKTSDSNLIQICDIIQLVLSYLIFKIGKPHLGLDLRNDNTSKVQTNNSCFFIMCLAILK